MIYFLPSLNQKALYSKRLVGVKKRLSVKLAKLSTTYSQPLSPTFIVICLLNIKCTYSINSDAHRWNQNATVLN